MKPANVAPNLNWQLPLKLDDLALSHMGDVRSVPGQREYLFDSETDLNGFLEAVFDHPNSPFKQLPYSLNDRDGEHVFGYSLCQMCKGLHIPSDREGVCQDCCKKGITEPF